MILFGKGDFAPVSFESVSLHLAGTISGVMTGLMVLQPAVGWVLDRMWTGEMEMGIRVYTIFAYRSGFGLMLGWIALSAILLLFTRETGCQQVAEVIKAQLF